MNSYQEILKTIKGVKNILIASHENPDPDAVGSVLSFYQVFKKLNIESLCYLPDPAPQYLNFLPGFYLIKNSLDQLSFDTLLALDYGDFERLRIPRQFFSEKQIITIDHHQGEQRGEIKIVKPGLSSTSEIIYQFLKENQLDVSKEIATCLLTGIIFDTGGFSHISTSPQTMKIASELLLKGAPLSKISRSALNPGFQQDFSSLTTKIWGRALSRIKFDEGIGLVHSWISWQDLQDHQVNPSDLAGISSLISGVFPAKLALFLVEYEKGKIKGSLRSEPLRGERVDFLAQKLGGGGHLYAAGFKQEGTIEEVLKKVRKMIE